jgi:hypothetical protein
MCDIVTVDRMGILLFLNLLFKEGLYSLDLSIYLLIYLYYPYRCHKFCDRLCGLVVRAPGIRSKGPGSILDATGFSEN